MASHVVEFLFALVLKITLMVYPDAARSGTVQSTRNINVATLSADAEFMVPSPMYYVQSGMIILGCI